MADFKAGDRVVKMSGFSAGKFGTVNSVMENGTLNVTFDGERLPKYCDPMRCGSVAENAKFKVGDRVIIKEWAKQKTAGYGRGTIVKKVGAQFLVRPDEQSHEKYYVPTYAWNEDDLVAANACAQVAANAVEFTNPNYRPEAGMRFLDENFSMFDPKVAKAMIEDARRKGVKVPPGVIEKARRAGLISNAVRNERIRAYPDGPGEWILVDAVGDEGIGRTTATDERGIKAQLADIAVKTYRWHRPEIVIMREKYYSNAARNAVARNAGRFELVEHNMGRSFGVYDSATSGYIADDIPLRDALRILKAKGETAEQAKKDLDWTDPAAIDRLW